MKKSFWSLIFIIGLSFFSTYSFAENSLQFATEATALDLDNAKLSLVQVEHIIKIAKQNLRDYQEQLQALNIGTHDKNYVFTRDILKTKIQNQRDLLTLNEERHESLLKIIDIFSSQLKDEQRELQVSIDLQQHQANLAHEEQMQNAIQQLGEEQNYWLNQLSVLNQSVNIKTYNASPQSYDATLEKIFIAEENSTLTQFRINLLHLNTALQNIFSNINENTSATELNRQRQDLFSATADLEQNQTILTQKIQLLKQRQTLLEQRPSQDNKQTDAELHIQQFIVQYEALQQNVTALITQSSYEEEKATALLAKALAHRQELPGNITEWLTLSKGLMQMGIMSYQVSAATLHDIVNDLYQLDSTKKIKLISLPFFMLFAYVLTRLCCKKIQQKLSPLPNNILHRFIDGVFKIFLSHLWLILLFFAWLLFLTILNIANHVFDLAWHIGNTILIFSIAHMTARTLLYQNTTSHAGDDVKLYHRLCWLFFFGFLVTTLMCIAESLNSAYEVQDLFDRLCMLFIFITGLMLLKAWRVVPQLIIPFINPKQNYFILSVQLLGVLLPLIILSNAVIGLIGFVEFAWTISKYEGLFLLVATTYLILKGLSNDALNTFANYIIRLRSGWIYSEAFLKPFSIWLHIALFLASLYFLLHLYGLEHQPFLVNYFYKVLHFPIISYSNNTITVWTFIKASIVALFSIWATKWSREFFYRRLYRDIRDIGARNSLSIFSQYGVFILGTLLTLKVLQLDFTTLNYILSGLALGLGFGLRDLANNFVSGLLILVERPMRRGDTVSIGEHEGKVTNIGMRATTVLSSDNREVLVPNSEVFSKIFTNWTHYDDIVRCETEIKVRWQQDPHQLQHEIEGAMLNTPGVLEKPKPEALLKSMVDGLLEFEIRFYIDYRINDSRMMMKSQVLFKIWDKFTELGVNPPYPTHLVHIEKES